MKTLLRTFAIALLATSVTSFAQPVDEKTADNNQTTMTQKEVKHNNKKAQKQGKPAKSKTTNEQDKAYDPTIGIWG